MKNRGEEREGEGKGEEREREREREREKQELIASLFVMSESRGSGF